MISALLVSNVLLWIVVILLGATLLALVRQIGVLHERVFPVGAMLTGDGPRIGELVPELQLTDIEDRPVRIGGNDATMAVCERLLERGFYAQGIRYPSVPEGSARLRITPMASHAEDEITSLVAAVAGEIAALR